MHYYVEALKKYADFSGRARRAEYWYFFLFNLIAALGLAVIGALVHTLIPYFIYLLAIIVPSIAVGVRRLHDIGRSGWWYLIALVPLVGPIILIVWFVTDSQPGSNLYGPNPKGIEGPSTGAPIPSVA